MIHDPGLNQNLDQIKDQAENVWRSLLEMLKVLKEAAKSPNVLIDQLQIIFRDESKILSNKKNEIQKHFFLVARNNTYFVLLGLGFGAAGGIGIGMVRERQTLNSIN